jgi:fatty-acyl-CoA synthase
MEVTGQEVLARSIELADSYCDAPPSSVVLLLLPHSAELFLLHLGLILRGRLPAILAWPTNRVDPEKYQRNVLHQLQNLPAAQLITLPQLGRSLDPGLSYRVTECPITDHERLEKSFLVELGIARVSKQIPDRAVEDTPKDALFLQFSGGTTGAQKCVVVTAPMLVNQLRRLSDALQFTSRDGVVSWLPMYHDMGLIACFWLPLWNGAPSMQFAAMDWLLDPGMLFRLMSQYSASFCWLPNFSFSYLAGQRARVGKATNLAHVRAWINCSEPVRERSFQAFTKAFAELGVRAEQCQASYAMAENVFAISQTPLGVPPRTISRDRIRGLTTMDASQTTYDLLDDHYVSSGRVLDGMQVRIREFNGQLCSDRIAGGIEICGESLFCGYWGNVGFSTLPLTADGWYATGDYGFMDDGDLYVIGRVKDVIIVGGQNIFPEDVETLANSVEGVYQGRVVAFGVDDAVQGSENLAVVAEMRGEFERRRAKAIEREIHRLISSVLGVTARHVRVVSERWIVKSTAGKISRRENRQRFLQEASHPRRERYTQAERSP